MGRRRGSKNKDDKPIKKGAGEKIVRVNKDSEEYKNKIQKIYELIRQGGRSNEIYANMLVDDEELSISAFNDLLAEAYRLAEIGIHKDREYIFQLHMERYEKIFEESMRMENSWHHPLDPKKDWHIIVKKYISAMKALEAKEHLIGLHDKTMVFEFNDQRAVVIEKEENRGNHLPGFRLDNLTLEEQIELLDYIRECRAIPVEGIQRVVIKQKKIEISITDGARREMTATTNIDKLDTYIKDVEFEEMPENVVNKFKDIPSKEEIVEIGPGSVIIEDFTDGAKEKGKSSDDVLNAVKETTLQRLKKKLGK
jgi:hypothetical protein